MKNQYLTPQSVIVQVQLEISLLTTSNLNINNETITTPFWDDSSDL